MPLQRLDGSNFGSKIYNKFPLQYQEDDFQIGEPLKRYLQALNDGGFNIIINYMNGILDLKDSSRTPLNVLYALYENLGLPMFNGIPENYLRSFLPYLSLSWKHKGSIEVVEYVCSAVTGVKITTSITHTDVRTSVFGEAKIGNSLMGNVDSYSTPIITVTLEMDFSVSDYLPDPVQLKRILLNFLPFYCDLQLIYKYVYSDEVSLLFREFDDFAITEERSDTSQISRFGVIKRGNSTFGVASPFGVSIFNNSEFTAPTEYSIDTPKSLDADNQGIRLINGNSILGTDVLNNFCLGIIPFEHHVRYLNQDDTQSVGSTDSCTSTIKVMSFSNATFRNAKMGFAKFGDNTFINSTVQY